jgi:hypothetical protein
MWTLIRLAAGLFVASKISDVSNEYANIIKAHHRRVMIETQLREIEAAKEVLKAYGYDKPRPVNTNGQVPQERM